MLWWSMAASRFLCHSCLLSRGTPTAGCMDGPTGRGALGSSCLASGQMVKSLKWQCQIHAHSKALLKYHLKALKGDSGTCVSDGERNYKLRRKCSVVRTRALNHTAVMYNVIRKFPFELYINFTSSAKCSLAPSSSW